MIRPSAPLGTNALARAGRIVIQSTAAASARRGFLTSTTQTIHATRDLPYPRDALFGLIADIRSYPHFLPFCLDARILEWSLPDSEQKRWPASAELAVGWGSIQEHYISQVHCVPGRIVESLAGEAQTRLTQDELKLYNDIRGKHSNAAGGEVFKSLRSTWSLHDPNRGSASRSTNVELEISFEFQNPLYAALAGAAIPKVAGTVLEAFEARAKDVLGAGH